MGVISSKGGHHYGLVYMCISSLYRVKETSRIWVWTFIYRRCLYCNSVHACGQVPCQRWRARFLWGLTSSLWPSRPCIPQAWSSGWRSQRRERTPAPPRCWRTWSRPRACCCPSRAPCCPGWCLSPPPSGGSQWEIPGKAQSQWMGERYHKLPLPCIITLTGFPFRRFFFFCRLVSLPTLGQATAKRGALPGVMEAACSPCDDLNNTAGQRPDSTNMESRLVRGTRGTGMICITKGSGRPCSRFKSFFYVVFVYLCDTFLLSLCIVLSFCPNI